MIKTLLSVCEKNNTPPDKKTGKQIRFECAKSGAGEQFMLLGRMAKAHVKGMFVHRQQYVPREFDPKDLSL